MLCGCPPSHSIPRARWSPSLSIRGLPTSQFQASSKFHAGVYSRSSRAFSMKSIQWSLEKLALSRLVLTTGWLGIDPYDLWYWPPSKLDPAFRKRQLYRQGVRYSSPKNDRSVEGYWSRKESSLAREQELANKRHSACGVSSEASSLRWRSSYRMDYRIYSNGKRSQTSFFHLSKRIDGLFDCSVTWFAVDIVQVFNGQPLLSASKTKTARCARSRGRLPRRNVVAPRAWWWWHCRALRQRTIYLSKGKVDRDRQDDSVLISDKAFWLKWRVWHRTATCVDGWIMLRTFSCQQNQLKISFLKSWGSL